MSRLGEQNLDKMRSNVRWWTLRVIGILGLGLYLVVSAANTQVFGQEPEQEEAEAPGEERGEDVAVRLYLTDEALPVDDPFAAEWDDVESSEFKLAPQVHWPERLLDATVKDVKVRGLHNGEAVAVLLEYQDPTKDQADAAGLEFMVGDKKAHFAHGQEMLQVEGGPVNIWYWKNKSGKAVDMSAKGFGTLRPQKHQDVTANGAWKDGTWRVVFSRSLTTENTEQDVQIIPGQWTNVAFAMWDGKMLETGAPKEKGSQKAISSWWYIRAEPPPDYSVFIYAFLGLGIAALFELALVKKLKKGQTG